MPVQRRDHGAGGAHHTGHLLQRFVEPIYQERTRWTVIDERNAGRRAVVVFHVDGARQLDLQAQKPCRLDAEIHPLQPGERLDRRRLGSTARHP